jgi:hypothetical protein
MMKFDIRHFFSWRSQATEPAATAWSPSLAME